jgi:ubiquinone biosynthesis protein UbiJ
MPATPVWLAAVESVLNRSIDGSQKALGLARRLDRTSLQLDVGGFVRIRAAVCGSRLALTAGGALEAGADSGAEAGHAAGAGDAAETGGGADAVISGSPLALFKLLTEGAGRTGGPPPDGARARTSARVAGDAEIAGRYRELFALARPDLEEELSRLVGDLPARRLSLAAQGAIGWIGKLGRTFGENVAEYLQEESRDLVGKTEVEEFVQGVDRARDTADRVEARLAGIERRLKGAP